MPGDIGNGHSGLSFGHDKGPGDMAGPSYENWNVLAPGNLVGLVHLENAQTHLKWQR